MCLVPTVNRSSSSRKSSVYALIAPGMVRAKVLSSPELAIEALARLVRTQ
jgi:hypothetical protein